MLHKIVICLIIIVVSVSSECEQGCRQYGQYTRVKRGKYYSSPPLKFYNYPPIPFPIKGPYSYTPPPFMADDEPSYPGSRPYKVSKRPTPPINNGLGDDDISNLVKYLSKQDLDKILEFAQEKGQGYNKYKDIYNSNEYARPYKRENKIIYKGNAHTKYEEQGTIKDNSKQINYMTEPTYVNVYTAQEDTTPYQLHFQDRPDQSVPVEAESSPWIPNDIKYLSPNQEESRINSQTSFKFSAYNNHENEHMYIKDVTTQEPSKPPNQVESNMFTSNQGVPINVDNFSPSQSYVNYQGPDNSPVSNNVYYSETNEEQKLPPPDNMREEDFEISYTNNVPKVVKADSDSSSYEVKNFGDLPLMDYNSKLHDVSSYHVPHYTITQPKPSKLPSPPVSFPSSQSVSSSSTTLLKPSPAAAAIKEPVYERAPPVSLAAEQSDAHLKAIKIWSHKSQGMAYTLHDDGSLSPERSRPKYG